MPDKEFDNLFRNKFSDAEIVPSADLWANIEQQLGPKRKRSIPIYWMAAASVAVAITALLVFQKTEKIRLRGTTEVATLGQTADPITAAGTAIGEETMANTATNHVFANTQVKTMKVRTAENVPAENNLQQKEGDLQPSAMIAHLPIKKIEIEPMNVVPKEAMAATPTEQSQTMMASAEVPQQLGNMNTISETEFATEKKGIRNVGDLVNFVVDKIDKRDKKLIRFNTDDDDNSSIVGINLGFVRLNPKNKNKN